MTKYLVTIKEVWGQNVLVEADSPENAMDLVREGEGEYLDGPANFEFVGVLDCSTWEVVDG